MSEAYRLVYSGEVQDGQHPAVVKKRLAAVLKLDDERMEVLFSGKSVVVKKATDAQTASRYQQAFQKVGARLRVLPVEDDTQAPPAPVADATDAAPTTENTDGFEVLPVGSDLLNNAERAEPQAVEVPTDHLKVQGAVFDTTDPSPESAVEPPNVDHLTLAELGALLGKQAQEVVSVEITADFDLAELGAILGNDGETGVADMANVVAPDFELAEPGTPMGDTTPTPAPPPPDTSHIKLDD